MLPRTQRSIGTPGGATLKPLEERDRCREDYAILQLPVREIAKRRGISEKTLYNWKRTDAGTANDWDTKRATLTSSAGSLRGELLELAIVVTRRMREIIQEGKDPESSQIFALKRLLDSANAADRVEKAAPPQDKSKDDKRSPAEKMQEVFSIVEGAFGVAPKVPKPSGKSRKKGA